MAAIPKKTQTQRRRKTTSFTQLHPPNGLHRRLLHHLPAQGTRRPPRNVSGPIGRSHRCRCSAAKCLGTTTPRCVTVGSTSDFDRAERLRDRDEEPTTLVDMATEKGRKERNHRFSRGFRASVYIQTSRLQWGRVLSP